MAGSFAVLSAPEVLQQLRAKRARKETGYHAFYSTWLGGITLDPAAMVVPMDDHMVHRGHAVFDTATLVDGKLYRLEKHLDRFLRSAAAARLELPLSREGMVEAIKATIAASGKRTASVRYWLSAGPGNFYLFPKGCEPTFSCMIYSGLGISFEDGLAECSVLASTVPHKPPLLANCKSTNYMLNVLTHLASADGGGTFGIGVDDAGIISEAAIMNVGFVRDDGVLMTPKFDRILAGCTVQRAMELVPVCEKEGLLTGVEQRDITLEEAKRAKEVIFFGGDRGVLPVVRWDGEPVGDGKVGAVAARFRSLLDADTLESFDCAIDYDSTQTAAASENNNK
eukprot:TRINITY_DN14058_c0_g1_i1.p1 TRINITY_DN14058_c0_g1~~TRINITY_DN14058_c0_g1_i1.p1  ORF type:complete len:339 (-),score=60.88 TRINITY_DN14058_c0_g1_i1:43-1059(-)